ncbi:MAG: S41 family peptidase [Sphingobacteriaceae bacterium]|nr:S41 family peptidase [Sphingobacteriaceae bacterium]
MKERILTFVFLFCITCSYGQAKYTTLVDGVLQKAKETSMYSSTINWDSLNKQVHLKAESANTIQELKPAFELLLNSLRDHHGKIINAKDYSYVAWFTDYKNRRHIDNRKFDTDIWKIVNDTALKFEYKLLNDGIGYLKIVGIGATVDNTKEAEKIRNAVIKLSKNKANGWIVDLRYNGGGNMYPMVTGLGTLIGDGIVGKLVSASKDTLFHWKIINGNFIYDVLDVITLKNNPKFKTSPKVAVLTSRWTVSSGEVLATCFKGRPNTKFFGEATGGFTTNNNWEIINEQLILNISTGIYCDRNGIIYDKNIPVDVEIPFEVVKETEKDKSVIEAIKWLKQK